MRSRFAGGQVCTAAAENYHELLVPALFAQWVQPMLDAVAPGVGERLLDVGTGTGVLARAASIRVGTSGSVIGLDPNEGMLAVAERLTQGLDLRCGYAEEMPIGDGEIDCVVCQFALMFFTDRAAAVSEVKRVLRPGGRIAVATWASIDQLPGFAAMADLFGDELGDWAADAMRAPFAVGTPEALADVLRPAFPDVVVVRREGVARFGSIDDWLYSEIRGWTLSDHVDEAQYARLRTSAARRLAAFACADGTVRFPAPALIATATRG
ncbi:methyltransferase type 11 [Mycolicibacterium agri]|uniref:Methyltransferase type 11 n=1 Tax=Mycolicibacterium agri TaxID=36811 RepID=A0A2A7N969_MYCAG|nr:methyltransferase domain-containing protein [Mycolicibacterium agri]PEG40001.1 methyltransferase type 11 [Mycolicibacterium agri]GFG51512.1 ubiquinone/menaquinone biosynthesis methyltransferase [Mycolicibacterium agri]